MLLRCGESETIKLHKRSIPPIFVSQITSRRFSYHFTLYHFMSSSMNIMRNFFILIYSLRLFSPIFYSAKHHLISICYSQCSFTQSRSWNSTYESSSVPKQLVLLSGTPMPEKLSNNPTHVNLFLAPEAYRSWPLRNLERALTDRST